MWMGWEAGFASRVMGHVKLEGQSSRSDHTELSILKIAVPHPQLLPPKMGAAPLRTDVALSDFERFATA